MRTRVHDAFPGREADTSVRGASHGVPGGRSGAETFGVVEGAVDLSVRDEVIARLGPDEVFGEMALVDSSPRMATAVAVESTVLAGRRVAVRRFACR